MISGAHPSDVLTNMNSVLRRIDLTCKLLAPVVTGFVISFVSLKASALTLSLWTVVTIWVEYWLFMSVYKGIPALGESSSRKITRNSPTNNPEEITTTRESQIPHEGDNAATPDKSWRRKMINWVSKTLCLGSWRVYFQQEVVLPGVALALLFFTVLRL